MDAIRDVGVPGVAAEVREGDRRIVARSGVAELRAHRPMPYDGTFRIASNTKVFVATLALLLVGEGRLSLDDTVERHLPGLVTGHRNDGRRITVRDLLQHTSGLTDYGADLPIRSGADFAREHLRTYRPEQLVAMSMRHAPGWYPGPGERRFGYSNVNYVLTGMIIERITGDTWEHGVRDRIAAPLGLRRTYGPGTRPLLPRPHARTYFRFPGEPLIDTTILNASVVDAAGAMVSTLDDLNSFLRALIGGRLLKSPELNLMRRTIFAAEDALQELYPGTRYGLGLMRRPLTCGGTYWSHVGEGISGATRNGVTSNAHRSVAIHMTTEASIPSTRKRQEAAAANLIDQALCGHL
ncbi:serine hydrolase domain-containing protein [Spirillospora sp. CA-294931]|uniref:serine hydrolase domain-containing protein n=1 Tax=Spirillospora sp. CA-294931 TaxID=3240042 RepID=UPI003D8FA036